MEKVIYVLGFAFSRHGHCVLMRRTKDDWQKGKVNGIGGKVQEGDPTPKAAMVREFREETGMDTSYNDWHWGLTIEGDGYELNVYRGQLDYPQSEDALYDSFPPCDEGEVFWARELPSEAEITARWLYYFCQDHTTFGLTIYR